MATNRRRSSAEDRGKECGSVTAREAGTVTVGRSSASRSVVSQSGAGRAAQRPSQVPSPQWPGLPSVEQIALNDGPVGCSVSLPYSSAQYLSELEALRYEVPELVWDRLAQGKPDKVGLGPWTCKGEWARYKTVCPKIVETALMVLRSLAKQDVNVAYGDVLDYRDSSLLGWHQDSMDLDRHTFTIVLTLHVEGEGRFEWRQITEDGLGDIVSSSRPVPGDLMIHGLQCNNLLAHRAFWRQGRRVTLVLFCRSEEMTSFLQTKGMESKLTMSRWWSEELSKEM